jgi:branched-chain amino acid transport system substrate-binding protein
MRKQNCSHKSFLYFVVISIIALVSCTSRDYICTDPSGCIEVKTGNPIWIAYILNLSGVTQSMGQESLDGIKLAINGYQGKIFGRTIELIGEKPDCLTEELLTAATRIALQPDIMGVIGPYCSQSYDSIYNVMSNAGQIMIGLPPLPRILPLIGSTPIPGLFRLTIDISAYSNTIAQFAFSQLGVQRAAIITDGSQSSIEYQQGFTNAFQLLGGKITSNAVILPGSLDIQYIVSDLVKEPPEIIFLPLFEHARSTIGFLSKQPELKDTKFLVDINFLATAINRFGDSLPVNRIYLIGPDLSHPAYHSYMKQWLLTYDEPPQSSYHIYAYDTTRILLEVIAKLGKVDPSGSMYIGRQALSLEISKTQNFEGLSGKITCQQSNECLLSQSVVIYSMPETQGVWWQWPPPVVWKPVGE